MKQTRCILMAQFLGMIFICMLFVVVFETGVLESGIAAGDDANTEFVLTTFMELMTLVSIPVALKLFKFKRVSDELAARKAEGLRKWGVLRLSILEFPLLANTLLYYIYMNTTFGYMAIIIVLTLPFVYPSLSRCLAEVEN